jgi:hypothetical protein
VPNILNHSTLIPFTIGAILVGIITYFIVLNVDDFASTFNRHYRNARQKLILDMQENPSESWKERGNLFEDFKPIVDRQKPTEWFIPIYWIVSRKNYLKKKIFPSERWNQDDTTNAGSPDHIDKPGHSAKVSMHRLWQWMMGDRRSQRAEAEEDAEAQVHYPRTETNPSSSGSGQSRAGSHRAEGSLYSEFGGRASDFSQRVSVQSRSDNQAKAVIPNPGTEDSPRLTRSSDSNSSGSKEKPMGD